MGESRTVPTVSAPDAEDFFTSGTQAWPPVNPGQSEAEQPSIVLVDLAEGRGFEAPASVLRGDPDDFPDPHMEPCCRRVDVPGVGPTHAFDCPQHPPTLVTRTAPTGPSLAPNALQHLLREEILSRLIFAARNLAESNIVRGNPGGVLSMGLALFCKECHFGSTSDGVIHHATSCNTGHVLRLIDELLAEPAFPNPLPKEAAPAEETGRADAGTRPRGLNQRVCLRCGERDTGCAWMSHAIEGDFDLSLLGLNQCISVAANLKKTLHTHLCPDFGTHEGGAA
jgi:hypothetical protein